MVAATGDAPASDGTPGFRGPRDARCPVFDCEPLAARLQKADRGMVLCSELGDVSELHAAARFALDSCPPCALAGLSELFIYTDGSASPPLARMRLPGSAGLLSVLGVAGPGATFSVRCFMAWPAQVMLSSTILLVTVTRWSWLQCYGLLFGW